MLLSTDSQAGPGPLIATCGKDGGVRLWDARAPAAPAAAFLPAAGSPARDAWCVALGDAHSSAGACVLAGYDNGDLKMFELRGSGGAAVRWETRLDKGVCGVQGRRGPCGAPRGACAGGAEDARAAGALHRFLPPAGVQCWDPAAGCPASSPSTQRRQKLPSTSQHSAPQFDRRDIAMNKFVATCLESRLALFDARTQHPAEGFAGSCEALPGRDATLWGVHHLPQVGWGFATDRMAGRRVHWPAGCPLTRRAAAALQSQAGSWPPHPTAAPSPLPAEPRRVHGHGRRRPAVDAPLPLPRPAVRWAVH